MSWVSVTHATVAQHIPVSLPQASSHSALQILGEAGRATSYFGVIFRAMASRCTGFASYLLPGRVAAGLGDSNREEDLGTFKRNLPGLGVVYDLCAACVVCAVCCVLAQNIFLSREVLKASVDTSDALRKKLLFVNRGLIERECPRLSRV